MRTLRETILSNVRLTAALIGLAMVLRAIVPSGYMIATNSLTITLEICADVTGQHLTRQIVIPRETSPEDSKPGSAKASTGCPFVSLWAVGLDSVAPVIVAIALAFILVLGPKRRRLPDLRNAPFLRPPLRAPPALS